MKINRVILLIIDGLGVGTMNDVGKERKQDIGANTLKSLIHMSSDAQYSHLRALGMMDLHSNEKLTYKGFNIRKGSSCLKYPGADSFLGHKEIIGLPVNVKKTYLSEQRIKIERMLKKEKRDFRWLRKDILIIDKDIYVGNNIESDMGNNINIYGNLDVFTFSEILKVGSLFRSLLKCARVIVHGVNPSINEQKVLFGSKYRFDQQKRKKIMGISSGKMKIHNGKQSVVHMGFQDENRENLIDRFLEKRMPVCLIGKTADLFGSKVVGKKNCEATNVVYTKKLVTIMQKRMESVSKGLLFVNIQEIDLSGHNEDIANARDTLRTIDSYIPKLLASLRKNDLFIIAADHGNDPTIGHDMHTRENVPVIAISKAIKPGTVGSRKSLSDIASTICDAMGFKPIKTGKSFLI